MRAATEYRKHAEECRRLAQQMVAPEDKLALEELAETWEMLWKLHERELVAEDRQIKKEAAPQRRPREEPPSNVPFPHRSPHGRDIKSYRSFAVSAR